MTLLDPSRTQTTASAQAGRRAGAPSPALLQRRIRDVHLYFSMLCAPSLLFFAVTGALQLFDLHEFKPGQSFEPPALLQELGMVHKKQLFALPRRPPQKGPDPAQGAAASPSAVAPAEAARPASWKTLALKMFFLMTAIGLVLSTCLGIWIAVRPGRNRRLAWTLLLVGATAPALLLMV